MSLYWGKKGVALSICDFKKNVPKKFFAAFHNGFNYNNYFFIKKFAEEFKKQFTCLRNNTKKYIIFTVPIEKRSYKSL